MSLSKEIRVTSSCSLGRRVKTSTRRFAVIACAAAMFAGTGPAVEANAAPDTGYLLPADDIIDQNLDMLATDFISKYCLGSVRRAFPSEHLFEPVRLIQGGSSASYKTARKLLNHSRFRK